MPKLIDLSGQKFGRLTVLKRAENKGKQTAWTCKCDCGNTTVVSACNLKSGHTHSCGCLWDEVVPTVNNELNTRHGETNTKLHKAWRNMRYRCFTPSCEAYGNYGGRGITVCAEWESYEAFRDWSLNNGFGEGLSLDRIDNDGDYCPENCRWVSMKVQQNNRRVNHCITFNGATRTIGEWATVTGIGWTTIKERLKRGWSIGDALTKTPQKRRNASLAGCDCG